MPSHLSNNSALPQSENKDQDAGSQGAASSAPIAILGAASSAPTLLQPPKWVILGINNVCNLQCRMCDVGLGERATVFWANLIGDHPQNMPLDLLQEIVRQARDFPAPPRFGLAFTEPLIHPRVVEFAREIVGHGFHCAITSNGTTLERLADALVEAGVQQLNLSIDGPEAVHNRIRGGRETFQKLYRGVEALNAARRRRKTEFPRLTFSFTITDQNQDQILAFLQQVAPLRPDHVVISQLNFITGAMAQAHNTRYGGALAVTRSNLGEMEPETFDTAALACELARVRAYLADHSDAFPKVTLVPDQIGAEQLAAYYQNPLEFVGGRRCTDPWKMLMVRTDGSVIPAHGRCYNVPVGNVREAPLQEIWNGPRFQQFRQTLQEAGGTLPACARCCGVIGKPKGE